MRRQHNRLSVVLAARAAASLRRNGIPDPLDSVKEITPQGLVALGVTKADQQREFAFGARPMDPQHVHGG